MSNPLAVGIDIGGTKVAYALADTNGTVYNTHVIPMRREVAPSAFIKTEVAAGVQQLISDYALDDVAGVGIGVPGHINPQQGIVNNAVNLGWQNVPLAALLAQSMSIDVPIRVEMDVRAAISGEVAFGAARGVQNVVQLAIGTGLGGAAVLNGHLIRGVNFFAMEFGHMHLRGGQRPCTCGGIGCVETVLSGKGVLQGIAAYRADYPHSPLVTAEAPTTYDWLQALQASDPLALHILQDMRGALLDVLNLIYLTMNPQQVIISGGLGLAAANDLLRGVEEALHKPPYCPIPFPVNVVRSQLTSSALGASALVWHPM